jgi:hypothetical protein
MRIFSNFLEAAANILPSAVFFLSVVIQSHELAARVADEQFRGLEVI